MVDTQWDEQLRTLMNRARDEIKRAGDEMKTEAERLLNEVADPGPSSAR